MIEYYDRLSDLQKELIKAVAGDETGWKTRFHRLPREDKLFVGRIVFNQEVKNVRVTFEADSPLIYAEPA